MSPQPYTPSPKQGPTTTSLILSGASLGLVLGGGLYSMSPRPNANPAPPDLSHCIQCFADSFHRRRLSVPSKEALKILYELWSKLLIRGAYRDYLGSIQKGHWVACKEFCPGPFGVLWFCNPNLQKEASRRTRDAGM